MSGHRIPSDLHQSPIEQSLSTTNAEALGVDRCPCIINLSSAGAETRTLTRPTHAGDIVSLHMQVDGGDITLTVTGGYNETGDTTFVFSDVGQVLTLQSFMTTAGVFFWRKISDYGLGNQTPTASATALTAVTGVAAGYKIARGETALDGTNPTPVAHGLGTCISFVAVLKGTAAPGVGTSILTANINGANVDVYAWKVTATGDATLVASTGTESFYWVAVGVA